MRNFDLTIKHKSFRHLTGHIKFRKNSDTKCTKIGYHWFPIFPLPSSAPYAKIPLYTTFCAFLYISSVYWSWTYGEGKPFPEKIPYLVEKWVLTTDTDDYSYIHRSVYPSNWAWVVFFFLRPLFVLFRKAAGTRMGNRRRQVCAPWPSRRCAGCSAQRTEVSSGWCWSWDHYWSKRT